MKIYYDIPTELEMDEDPANHYEPIVMSLPESMRHGMRYFFDRYPKMNKELVKEQYERRRFEMMWKLRSIEKEMNSQEGCIILKNNGHHEIKGYNQSIEEHITYLLSFK